LRHLEHEKTVGHAYAGRVGTILMRR
jgi:hypothetical protein